jgi:hypothetical protein
MMLRAEQEHRRDAKYGGRVAEGYLVEGFYLSEELVQASYLL